MKKIIPFILLYILSSVVAAQPPQRLSFDFGYGINAYKMEGLNRYFVDSFAVKTGQLEEGIHRGEQFMAALRFQPVGSFDVGVYAMYQFAQTEGTPKFMIFNETGTGFDYIEWRYRLETQAVTLGLSANLFISNLLKFHEKESYLLKRLHISTEFCGGYSMAFAHSHAIMPAFTAFNEEYAARHDITRFDSRAFHGQVALKVSYDIIQSPLITSIGFRFGYQFMKTSVMQDRLGDEWVLASSGYPVQLDFSGLFGGVFVSLGR
jgi:hypothetical protein